MTAIEPTFEHGALRVATGPTYAIHLEFFSGPLDLLLHLVHQDEVPIDRVDMAKIADQYLKIISHFTSFGYAALDIEKAAEYLVIAATLVAIKSKSLLGAREKVTEVPSPQDNQDALFLEELRKRLQTYELIKLQAHALRELPQLGIDVFTRMDRAPLDTLEQEVFISDSSFRLGQVFAKLLKRIGESSRRLRIHLEPVSVVKFMMDMVDSLKSSLHFSRPRTFLDLARNFLGNDRVSLGNDLWGSEHGSFRCRSVLVGSFIALLELMRRGFVEAAQESEKCDITVKLRFNNDELFIESSLLDSRYESNLLSQEVPEASKVVSIADFRTEKQSLNLSLESNFREVRRG